MGSSIYIDSVTPGTAGSLIQAPAWVNTAAGENYSGAEAWLQVWQLDAGQGDPSDPGSVLLYSWSAADHGVVSEALPGNNARIPGRLIGPRVFVGWSDTADAWNAVDGTQNIAGEYQ